MKRIICITLVSTFGVGFMFLRSSPSLKGKDFFGVKESLLITFKSTKIVQTGPNIFDVRGDFTIRGVTKAEKLTLTNDSKGTATGSLDGTMAFDRQRLRHD